MAARVRRSGGNGLDAWPGYVDALSTLLMVIIFVLLVFVLSQAFLSVTLSGRNEALDDARRHLADLTSALSLERDRTASLSAQATQLNRELGDANQARSTLARQLTTLQQQAAQLGHEREQLTAQVSDINLTLATATLANQQLTARLADTEAKADAASQQAAAKAAQLADMERALRDTELQLAAARSQLEAMRTADRDAGSDGAGRQGDDRGEIVRSGEADRADPRAVRPAR